jgi:hypothetical protein
MVRNQQRAVAFGHIVGRRVLPTIPIGFGRGGGLCKSIAHIPPPAATHQKSICVVVPYRNTKYDGRKAHLDYFLETMPNLLNRLDVFWTIAVVEQTDSHPFNRGMLCNYGYVAGASNYTNIVFNDVDLIPDCDRLIAAYASDPHFPVHIAASNPKYRYSTYSGGIIMVSPVHFDLSGGFPELSGWGNEDDVFQMRLRKVGFFRSLWHSPAGKLIDLEDTMPLHPDERQDKSKRHKKSVASLVPLHCK